MRTLSPNPIARRLGLALVFTLWFAGVGWGMKLVLDYQVAAGPPAAAPTMWPASSGLARAANGPTLLLLLHPRCPCSRATVAELSRIVSHTRDRLAVDVLFVVPEGLDARWAMSDLYRAACAIPGVHVSLDPGGREARSFGGVTSGQALFYDAAGALRFAGGITPGRGHAGDNQGEATVEALALDHAGEPLAAASPVFGCALASPEKPGVRLAPVCRP